MSTTSATDLLSTRLPNEAIPEPVEVGDVCKHALSGHDRTATRYCDATQTNAQSRGCICRQTHSGR